MVTAFIGNNKSKMMTLCLDTIIRISEDLSDKDKIFLTMTSKAVDGLKFVFIYKQKIGIWIIKNLPYFDNFEKVIISYNDIVPKNAKSIYYKTGSTKVPPSDIFSW